MWHLASGCTSDLHWGMPETLSKPQACVVQMRALQQFCEGMVAGSLEVSGDNLETAWTTAAIIGGAGGGARLLDLCTQFTCEHFLDLVANGVVQRLAHRHAPTLTACLTQLLQARLKVMQTGVRSESRFGVGCCALNLYMRFRLVPCMQ